MSATLPLGVDGSSADERFGYAGHTFRSTVCDHSISRCRRIRDQKRLSAQPGIDATDTYEWLAGGFGLLHRVHARVGDQKVEGAEIIGWNPSRERYTTLYVGNDGPAAYEAQMTETDEVVTSTMVSDANRFQGRFSEDGNVITGHWELLEAGDWRPWMRITLTKLGPPPSAG